MITSSVHTLISQLCESLLREKQQNDTDVVDESYVRKLKSQAYEILLKKSFARVAIDVEHELNSQLFATQINGNSDPERWEELNRHLDVIAKEPYFQTEDGAAVLHFLIFLGNIAEVDDCAEPRTPAPHILVPGPFTLHSSDNKYMYSPEKLTPKIFSPPKYFKGLPTLKDAENPYLPKFIFEEENNKLRDIEKKFAPKSKKKCAPNSFTLANRPTNMRINVRAFQFAVEEEASDGNQLIEIPTQTLKRGPSQPKETAKLVSSQPKSFKIFSWNWSHLGQAGIVQDKPFLTERGENASLHIQGIYEKSCNDRVVAQIITFDKFMRDLKYLAVGIQSETFNHDLYIIFHMVPNVTISDILPNVMENYVSTFLECGTCYKRLQIMIMKNDYELRFEGFMFKALCSAVEEYLVMFRQFVFFCEDVTLLDFYKRMRKMMIQIANLSSTLGIHPNDSNVQLPLGSQFLGYIYKEIMRLTEKDLIMLLVFLLKRCCHVYFKHLQKWIFYGLLDDTSDELFICFVDHYRPNTKYFFDKAYFVRKESVPGFFQGFEDQILQCGKYTMLLKAFKPNHPLFDIEYPSISVCMSFEEIEQMEAACKKYADKAREVCGKPITVKSVFEMRNEKKKEFLKVVSQKSKLNMEKWAAEQEERAEIAHIMKKKRLEEVTNHLKEVNDRKIADRKANIALDLKFLKELEEIEDKRLLVENVNIKKRIEYYRELSEMLEKKPAMLTLEIPKENQQPETPLSTAGSGFESCFEFDDETESVYDECISPEFVEGFKETEKDLLEIPETGRLKKSISDILNSNEVEIVEETISDVRRNRNQAMGSTAFESCLAENDDLVKNSNKINNNELLSEAQKIKMKVLNLEFGIKMGTSTSDDVNSNPVMPIELTDLQKNRIKMMQNDTFAEFNKEPIRKSLNLDLTTERSRNRKKVLESEFNILTGTIPTPMSTTSDIQIVEQFEEISKKEETKKLNVNVDFPAVIATPEIALNTAGVLSKKGFNFTPEKNLRPIDAVEIDNKLPSIPELPVKDYESPYKRCEELLNSNFKCEPKCSVFRLKKSASFDKDTAEKLDYILKNRKDLNSLSVITLTEFLQKSVVTPMNVHLEIMNNEVMRVFLEDLNILGHFKSLRNYFFLMDGEFGSIICDGIIGKLEKGATPNELLNFQILHSILDTALGSSILGNDKNAENLSFIVSDMPEKFDMTSPSVLSNLCLSYRVNWPLNIILNPETLEQYANIFKYLIKVRRISWVLEESYQMLKEIAKTNGKDMLCSPQYKHVQLIRQKFFHFVNTLKNHITSNALQASWKTFKDDLMHATSIEQIYRKHTVYIKRIIFLCMLNRRSVEFLNTIESIFKISLRFYWNLKSRQWKKKPGNEHYTHSRYDNLVADEAEFEKFIKYTIYLGNKIVRHGYQEKIGEFISFINYNSYYVPND